MLTAKGSLTDLKLASVFLLSVCWQPDCLQLFVGVEAAKMASMQHRMIVWAEVKLDFQCTYPISIGRF